MVCIPIPLLAPVTTTTFPVRSSPFNTCMAVEYPSSLFVLFLVKIWASLGSEYVVRLLMTLWKIGTQKVQVEISPWLNSLSIDNNWKIRISRIFPERTLNNLQLFSLQLVLTQRRKHSPYYHIASASHVEVLNFKTMIIINSMLIHWSGVLW